MNSKKENLRIIVAGATGWLGRETLEVLSSLDQRGKVETEIFAISSKARDMELSLGEIVKTQTFQDPDPKQETDGFISLAFLTRDKVSSYGTENYVAKNLELISSACRLIVKTKPKWIVLVSSGAIFQSKSSELEVDVLTNPYGFCKRLEELMIAEVAREIGANLVIGRLWGASGAYMPINRAYALSDLICQALDNPEIKINSAHQVFRRYCDAGEFMKVLIGLAKRGDQVVLDSGGPLIEIMDLAVEIATNVINVNILRELDPMAVADDYYPRSSDFESSAKELGISLSSIHEQIQRTFLGHKAQSNP